MSSERDKRLDKEEIGYTNSFVERREQPVLEATPATCEAPNGGFMSWLQVAAAFCLFLNTWSVLLVNFKFSHPD